MWANKPSQQMALKQSLIFCFFFFLFNFHWCVENTIFVAEKHLFFFLLSLSLASRFASNPILMSSLLKLSKELGRRSGGGLELESESKVDLEGLAKRSKLESRKGRKGWVFLLATILETSISSSSCFIMSIKSLFYCCVGDDDSYDRSIICSSMYDISYV